jgi:hypothetical protein
VVPIHAEAEEAEIEFLGLLEIEDPQDRDAHLEADAVGACQQWLLALASLALADLGGQNVPVVIAELAGDDLERPGIWRARPGD